MAMYRTATRGIPRLWVGLGGSGRQGRREGGMDGGREGGREGGRQVAVQRCPSPPLAGFGTTEARSPTLVHIHI